MISPDTTIVDRRSHLELSRTIFLGTRDRPGLDTGQLVLSQKGGDPRHASITEFVCAQTNATIAEWKLALGLALDPSRPFADQVIEVEDVSPDTCLGLVALALRLAGRGVPTRWIDYARFWELGDVHATGHADRSFGALQSALTHAQFKAMGGSAEALDGAFRIGMVYTERLVALDVDPAKLPRTLSVPRSDPLFGLHSRAQTCLAFERAIYRRLVSSATQVQLAVDVGLGIAGAKHQVLVDGLIFSEIELTGALKVFARTDHTSPSGNGYGLMALHRPEEAMTGYDMAVSVDPTAQLSLAALWDELERREEAAWAAFAARPGGYARPRDRVRPLASHARSHSPTEPSNEPWWDNNGDLTLVAAPRALEINGVRSPGTRLVWSDVKEAIWTCYAPHFGLRVRPRGSTIDDDHALTQLPSDYFRSLGRESGLVLADLERTGAQRNQIAVWSPTLAAACAAMIDGAAVELDTLPSPDAYDVIEGRDGIVVVARRGLLLLRLDPGGAFPANELRRVVGEVATTVISVGRLEAMRSARGSGIRELVRKAVESGGDAYKRDALRAIYRAKLSAREAWDTAQHFETDSLVRRVREACEARWGARERLDRAIAEIDELEEMVVSSSEVRANGLLNKLAIFGLPASVFGNLLGGLLLVDKQEFLGISRPVAVGYVVFVALGIFALALLSWKTTRSWRLDK
ncbi:MAG: hypothetical protein AB7U95_20095 [Reyranella sp.]